MVFSPNSFFPLVWRDPTALHDWMGNEIPHVCPWSVLGCLPSWSCLRTPPNTAWHFHELPEALEWVPHNAAELRFNTEVFQHHGALFNTDGHQARKSHYTRLYLPFHSFCHHSQLLTTGELVSWALIWKSNWDQDLFSKRKFLRMNALGFGWTLTDRVKVLLWSSSSQFTTTFSQWPSLIISLTVLYAITLQYFTCTAHLWQLLSPHTLHHIRLQSSSPEVTID